MAINAAVWIFFLCISWSCCDDTRQQYILDYTIVDTDPGGLQLVDEAIYQRDILEDADAHFALYHKDDTHRVRRPLLSGGSQGLAQRSNENAFFPKIDNSPGDRPTMFPPRGTGKQQSVIGINSDNIQSSTNSKDIPNSDTVQRLLVPNNQASSSPHKDIKLADILSSSSVHSNSVYPQRLGNQGIFDIGGGDQEGGNKVGDDYQVSGEKKRLPQAVVIGVKKAGTRALLEYLKMHPDVKAPGPEPHFFDKNYDKGYQWYRWVACLLVLSKAVMVECQHTNLLHLRLCI